MQFKTAHPASIPIPTANELVQPTATAQHEQKKQSYQAALAEIEELKQTLRYLEISITKSKEEKEKLTQTIDKQNQKTDVSQIDSKL